MSLGSKQLPAEATGAGPGFLATAILASAYLGFTALMAFAPGVLTAPIHAGGTLTMAFALGLGVILLGFALTVAYAVIGNRREMQADADSAILAAEGAAE
ncbi:DUF485 domain-containing protein [Xanthobacter autotrophicus]